MLSSSHTEVFMEPQSHARDTPRGRSPQIRMQEEGGATNGHTDGKKRKGGTSYECE